MTSVNDPKCAVNLPVNVENSPLQVTEKAHVLSVSQCAEVIELCRYRLNQSLPSPLRANTWTPKNLAHIFNEYNCESFANGLVAIVDWKEHRTKYLTRKLDGAEGGPTPDLRIANAALF